MVYIRLGVSVMYLHIIPADVTASVVVAHNPTVPAGEIGHFDQREALSETLADSLLA